MRSLARLLTVLLGIAFAAEPASAVCSLHAQNSASGSATIVENLIGGNARLSGEGVSEIPAIAYDFASDFPVASNGTRITGLARHGINRAIGDGASRAGTRPQAILDALKNPKKIVQGIDSQGRPFHVFHGTDARVVVNPQTGQIVSTNPLSAAGAL